MIADNIVNFMVRNRSRRYFKTQNQKAVPFPAANPQKQYLLYIHIPFCEELCPYCSFNRFPYREGAAAAYFKSLYRELRLIKAYGYRFSQVYIGGGTPTVNPDGLAKTIALTKDLYGVQTFSVETNPNYLSREQINRLKGMDIQRLSVGVQSFNDGLLKTMGRYHKYGSGLEIKKRLTSVLGEFNTLNVDMIFNFPSQTGAMLKQDLKAVIELGPDQVTFYPLMLSGGKRKAVDTPARFSGMDYKKEKIFYNHIYDRLSSIYTPSTAWCFSRQKGLIDEYIIDYDEYVGAGSGAFSYLNGTIFINTFSLPQYTARLNLGVLPHFFTRNFKPAERMQYDFLVGLFGGRLDTDRLDKKYAGRFTVQMRPEITFFKVLGTLKKDKHGLYLTRRGRYYWIIMMREFFTSVNEFRDYCRAALP